MNETSTDNVSGTVVTTEMIYVVGTTWGFMDEGAHALNGFGQFGGRDVVLIKLTRDGNKLWARQVSVSPSTLVVSFSSLTTCFHFHALQFGSTANDFGLGVMVDHSFNSLLLTGGCITDQVSAVVEVNVNTVLEAREPFAQYETQLMDSHTRTGVRPQQYEFAASFNFQGDLLDFTMDGGVTITPRRQRIEENGVKGEYSVVLNRKPLNDVTVRADVVMLVDPSGLKVQQLRLPNDTSHKVTFTRSNWNREQIVRVTAVDDSYAEGVHYAVITHSSSSLDPNFNGSQTPFLYGRNLTMQVNDNDFAGIRLSRTHMYVGEGGMNDSYNIVLSSKPWYPVDVTILAMHPNQTQVKTPLITFMPETWNISQTVVVSAVDDLVSEVEFGGLHYGGKLIHYSESKDFRYNTRRPRCFDVPNCDPAAVTTTCLKPDLTAQVPVRVCDLTNECSFTLSNGACVADVLPSLSGAQGIPAYFGSRPLDPSLSTSTSANEIAISYTKLQSLLLHEQMDFNTSRPRNITTGLLSYVPPPPELRGFVLSFLGLLNLDQVQRLGQNPIRVLHAVCAGMSRLETHRWAFEEWPSGYVNQVLQIVLIMFPDIIDERRVWNCGAAVFRPGNSLNVTIWDNDPGVTLSSASLLVIEAGAADTSADAVATYSIVLNAPPSSNDGSLQPAISMCSLPGSDFCGFWDDFSALAAQIYSQPSAPANVSIAIVGNSQISVSPSLVTFTTANWFTPQWISVRAVNDAIAEAEATFLITHRVQNSPFGYTNTTAFWLQGTLPALPYRQFPTNTTISGSELKMPYNTIPTLLNAPAHQHVNVRVQDDDSAGVEIIVNQPERDLITKESSDTVDWVGDYATSFAFSDISLSTKFTDTGSALVSILVLGPDTTSYMKFHLPSTHEGDSKLTFSFAILRFYQTPFKIFNASDASEDSTLSSSDAGLFTKTYRLRITLVQNSWTRTGVSAQNASVPSELAFAATKSINVTAIVEKSRPIDLNVTALVAQLLPTRASVLSFKIEVLAGVANTTQSVTQMCSSLFERKLRPTLQLGYRFSNLLLQGAATQSSTAAVTSGSASVATDGDRNVNRTTSTASELEPYWETCFDETKKLGQVALFLPESMNSVKASDSGKEVAVNIVGIATLLQMSNATKSLKDAMAFGCPESCPLIRRTTVRKGIILWEIQVGVRCLRIYREGTGCLELVEVEAYDSFVSVTPTADGAGLRSRLKSDWTAQKASDSWRVQQSAKRSEDENLALGMATRQSSTNTENAFAYLAVDGQQAATWDSAIIQNASAALESQGSQQQLAPGSTRTLLENGPWWEVDLGAVKPISTVVLYPYIGMPGRGFCSTTTSSSSSSNTKYPEWSGDLYSYSRTDSLLMLQDPFKQDFEVLITDVSLATANDPSSVIVTCRTTLSFSCENGTTSITWADAFTKGRFVTVRKQGLGILMLNEVKVNRWNPGTAPRYLLLDLYSFGTNPMALSSIQLFPPTDSLIAPDSSGGEFALPIAYEIHSLSSQLTTSGAGSAAALKSLLSSGCYVAAKTSFHEWIVLDLLKPTRVGLIEMDTSVAKCGANVTQPTAISIAVYGAVLDGIRSVQATSALSMATETCEIDTMGVLKGSISLASCKAFLCEEAACNSHLRAVGTASTLVLSDFSDVVLLGMVDFFPIARLPLSLNEHRAMVLRDNPVALWTFDDLVKTPIFSTGVDASTKRATRALGFPSTGTSKQFLVDDAKENTFYSNDVLLQASMPAFSLEFWVLLTQNIVFTTTSSADSVVNIVTMDSASVVFASIGVSKTNPGGFFKLVDSVSGKSCLAAVDSDILSSSASTQMWSHVVASYDPSTATITLTYNYNLPGGGEMTQKSAKTTCTLAIFNVQRKTLNFGSYKPFASTTNMPGFIGKLSNVAWYLRALGRSEILDHYHDFISGATDATTFAHSSYALRLSSKPLAPVAININAETQCYRFNLCNVSVVPSSVVITPENWMELTQIHIVATNDQLYEGDHITQLEFQATSKPSYQLVSMASTLDLLALANGSNTTTVFRDYERRVSRFYRDLQLRRVLIDPQVLRLRENSLMTLQANWSRVRIDYRVIVNEPYNGLLNIDTLTIDLIDMSVPGIEFSTTSLIVSENGKGNDYQVLLLSEPKSSVVISISVAENCYRNCSTMVSRLCPSQARKDDTATLVCGDESTPTKLCNITISPSIMYFSSANWSLPQTVRVVAVDDQLDEADLHLTSIKTISRSLDPVYDALFLPDIVVAVEDNDVTDVLYSTKYVTLSEKPSNGTYRSTFNYSATNFYMLSLATEPWANVTVAMSNEANRSCYRPCGYHFDKVNCGLPRQQSVTSVRLSTNSTREIHRIALSIPKVIEVQRIVTYAEHVDQVFRVQVTGGFVEEVQAVTFTLSDAFKLRFKSADAMTSAVTYGRTFRIGSSDRMTSSTFVDGFASAAQVESALNTLFKVDSGFRVTRTLLYDQSTLIWAITFARLVGEDATFPTLTVTTSTPFEGTLTIARKSASVAPTGNILFRYGASDSQPLQVPILIKALGLQATLSNLQAVYTVAVARTIHQSAYGFEYTVTFKSVDVFYSLQADNKSLVAAPNAINNVTILVTETQNPERIGGAFTVEYISTFNSTNNVTCTSALPWNASETLVQSEISRINGIGNVSVSRQKLSAEGGMEWTVEFSQNNGQMRPLTVKSVNLTGRSVTVALDTVRDGESLGGFYVVEMGGRFKKMKPSTQRVYWMESAMKNTTALPFNTTPTQLQQALLALNITEPTNVTREDLDCDAFAVCNGYTWTINYAYSPGDVPPIRVYGTNKTLTGAGATISATTVANGTYIGGQFSLKLDLYDLDTKVWYSGETWNLPVNVSAVGMDEALEAIPFVRSNREAEFNPETRLWRGIKFDKGVRVYREGPYLDGGYTWRLEWAIEDYIRFQDLQITINASLVTQEVEPLAVPTQFDLMGYPRCSAIPTSRFQADKSDPFGLRGYCVYDITNVTIQERFLCNYTVENPWIVFTPENWCVPQMVRLSAVDDFIDEATVQNGNVTFSNVTHTVFSDDLLYAKLPLAPVLTEVESDDFAEVLVSETTLQVREDGLLDAKYLLQLKTEPLYSVKIVVLPWLDGDNTGCYRFGLCNLTIPVFEFTFTPKDWDIPQSVVVKATDDDLDEYDVHATGISHIAYSDDLKYNNIAIPKINVTVIDNDISALKVLKKTVAVTEGEVFDTYDVVLGSEPFAKVTVTIANVGTVGNYANTTPSTLLFTWKNWNVSQTVRVDALDDFTQDEVNSSSTLVHTITSDDLIYAKLKGLARVTVSITDNDVSGLSLSTQLMNVTESNVTVYTYGVRLNTEPWQPVVVLPNANHGCYVRVLSSETLCNATIMNPRLYFGPGNWSAWQNVSFLAFDDWLVENPVHQALITHTSISKDPLYQVANYTDRNASLRLRITDNDLAFVNISLQVAANTNRSQLHVAEGGFNDSYRVFLNSEPYEDVLLTLQPTIEAIVDQNDKTLFLQAQVGVAFGTSSSAVSVLSNVTRAIQIVFTALDWNQPRVITVFAIDDKIAEDSTHYSTIGHEVVSVDAKYNVSNSSLGVTSVKVMVNDKEAIPPPIPIAATFDASGSKLQVTFDSSVYHAETMAVRTDLTTSGALALSSLYAIKLKRFSCSLVFDFGLSKYSLGKGAFCYWLDLKNLRMELGSGATIAVKDALLLNECAVFANQYCQSLNVIRARHTSRSYTQASVAVQVPSDIVEPKPVLMVPEDAGSCGTWAVDGTLSQGAGGRSFTQIFWFMLPKAFFLTSNLGDADASLARAKLLYQSLSRLCLKYTTDWKTGKSSSVFVSKADLSANPDLAFVTTMAQLRSACYLRSLAQSATDSLSFKIQIDSMLLEAGVGYSVGLELTNAFDQRMVLIKDVQVRNLPGPSLFVVGERSLEVTRVGDPIVLQVDATVSCTEVIGTAVGYVWTASSVLIDDTSGTTTYTVVDLSKANVAKDPRVFKIPRTALEAEKSYRFQVEGYMVNNSRASNSTAVIIVNVTSGALSATITGGSRAIGERDMLLLNGTSSFDPDLSTTPFSFSWACADVTNTSLVEPELCINASASSTDKLVPLDLTSSKGALLSLAPFSLQQNRTLTFTLTVAKTSTTGKMRTSNTSTTIWTLLGSVPDVTVAASVAKIVASSRVALTAQVKSTYPFTSRWVQAQGDLVLPSANDGTNASATSDAFALPLTSLNNVIVKNKLTPGLTYIFRLIATDVNGNQGFGSVTIKVNSPPSSGRFDVTPKSGYGIQDLFSLSCAEWADDLEDLPLKYSFGVIGTSDFNALVANASNDSSVLGAVLKMRTVPIVSEQLIPTASVMMLPPSGLKDSESVTIVAFISDSLGGFAFDSESIEVLLPAAAKSNPMGFVNDLLGLVGGANTSNASQRTKFLLSSASILQGAYSSGSNDSDGCSKADSNGKICSDHGACDPSTLKCVCADAYMGTKCKFEVSAVRTLNTAILSSLNDSSQVVEPTASALSQHALIIDTVVQSSPAVFNEDGLAQVASLSSGIIENAFTLQNQGEFLDSAGKTVLDSLSTVIAISSGSTVAPAASASIFELKGRSRRLAATSLALTGIDCSGDMPESNQTKATFGNTIGTLLSLTAIASKDALPDEDAIQISSTQIQALTSAGTSFKASGSSGPGLAVRLTEPAIACLEAELFLSAFVLAKPPHSLCSLKEAKQFSASTVFAVHSKAALNAVTSGANVSIKVQKLSSKSLCVAQAAAKVTSTVIATSAKRRRLAAEDSGLNGTFTDALTAANVGGGSELAWHPLVALTIPHLRPLSTIEQSNFTTACNVWNAQSSTWDAEICIKDDVTSTPLATVCYCTEIAKLEVLVTLEERLDYYALYKDLYRNEPSSVVPAVAAAMLFWLFLLGSRVGQRQDSTDEKKHKEKTIKGLNRAKWGELQERTTSSATVVLEDFTAFYARKKLETQAKEAENNANRLDEQSGVSDATTAALSGDGNEETMVLADVVTAATAIDPNVTLPNEARTLFGTTKTLETQYAFTRGCLRFCNAIVIVLGVVLAFVGVDFHLVLGNSTSELLLYVYGKSLGLILVIFGGVLAALGCFGLAVARADASHTSRNTYLTLFSLVFIAQLAFVTIAFKYLDDIESMPSALLSTLAQVWNALSADIKQEVEAFYGCCGFLSIKEASVCPEEALNAVPPRTCSHVLTLQAREFFGHSFGYLQVLFLVEAICITLANIFVKWRHLRLQQLAGEPASSANGETSTKRAILSSPLNVMLLCTLPSLYYLLSYFVLFAVFYGVDMVVQLNFVSNAVVSALFGVEIGGLVITMACVYLVILLRGIHALAYRDIRGLQWVVALSLAFFIVSFGVSQFFWGIEDNLLIDPVLIEKTEGRYLTLPRDILVKLELAMECCGFDANAEGTCVSSSSTTGSSGDQHVQIRTCRSIVEQILVSAIAVFNTRMTAIVIAEAVVFALSMVLLIRLRRFAGKPKIYPAGLAMTAPVEVDEYQTTFDIFVHNVCVFVIVLLNVLASVLGLLVLWAGVDTIYQLNVLHISYLLQTFDRRIGIHLVALGGGLEFFACVGFAVAWKRSRWVFLVYAVAGLALFAATFGAMGVSYRFAHTALSSDATNFRLEELWKSAAPTTKGFVQNAFMCCGYERRVTSNGTVVFTDMAQATFWTQTSETSSASVYSRSLQSSSEAAEAVVTVTTHRTLTETQTHTFTQAVCPPDADTGCSTVMKRYLVHVARYTFKSCIALLSFLVAVLVGASVLFLRQGKKTSWKQSWGMVMARSGLLVLSFGSIFASLTTLFIAVDLVMQWSIFSSSLLQLLFAFSVGIALLVYAAVGLSVNVYTLYATVDSVVHQIFFQCVGRGLFALSLWLGVALTGYLSRFSADSQHWQTQLTAFLDHKWNRLTPYTQHLISLDYQCCGFNDPLVVKGKGLVFDRPATGYTCPLSSARGCQHVLVAQISSSFGWLFIYLVCLAVIETLLLALSVLLLKQLKRIKVEEWFAIESRVRYAAGKYKSEARRSHLALSLFYSYDPKFTRAQRLTSILCSVLTTLAIFSGYFATKGCHRTSLKTCEQPDVWGMLGMGLLYGGLCGYAAQCACRFGFELIRHRCDDESSEVAGARQRKEKVLLFRSLFQRRRPHPRQSVPTASDVPGDKVGISSTALAANSLAPSTMDTSHATTEERWFTWLLRFVYRLYRIVAGGLFLVSCGIGTLMGLVLIGYSNTLYGVKIDQGPRELLVLSLLIALVSLLAWLAVDMRDRKRSGSHVVFIAVVIASLLLMACALLGVYMVYEVTTDPDTSVTSSSASIDNWSVRKTGFSVVKRLEEAWKAEASNYFRNRVQQDLQCCGFQSAEDYAFRPCPVGTTVQVEYEARSVNGSTFVKAQSEVRDLDGCLPKMLESFHSIADTIAYFAIGICLAQFLLICSAAFLAYDVVVSKDSKLKLRVNDGRKAQDVRQMFEKVVGLKIAAPARGKILSKMLSSSLDSVAPRIASELAAASLVASPPSHGDHLHRRPSVSSASKLASPNASVESVLSPQRRKSINQVWTSLDRGNDTAGHHHEEIASVPYPVSIVYVVFTLCGVWIALMLYLIFQSSIALGKVTAWRCVLCWGVGLGFHFLVIEPGVIFAQILWSTLGAWWAGTWLVRVIRYGREALRIKPDAATAAARYYASLSLYERIRFNAAVRIQRQLLTRVTRWRYLQLIREKRQEAHRSLAEQRRLTVKKAIEGFTEDEVRAFALIFRDADAANLGLVSHTVISQSIYQLGVRVTPELVFQFLEKLDPAYADLVDFEHFLYGMHCVRMHHQEEQNAAAAAAQTEATGKKSVGTASAGVKEEFVSSSARFGPAANPQSKIFVKRQNLLRELKEKRESLSYKLMSKVGKLPPLLQRGKSAAKANAAAGLSGSPRANLKHELSLDDVSDQSVTRDDGSFVSENATDEAPPTGAFVILQNRKLSPKKRALEMVLKKKHRDDRGGKAGGDAGVRDGEGGKSSPSKTVSSPTQRAKAMVQNWKMPSPRGWPSTNASANTSGHEAELSIAAVVEEENETMYEPEPAEASRPSGTVDRQIPTESSDASPVYASERVTNLTNNGEVKDSEAESTAETRLAPENLQKVLNTAPSDSVSAPKTLKGKVSTSGQKVQNPEDAHYDAVKITVEHEGVLSMNPVPVDGEMMKRELAAGEVHQKQIVNDNDEDDEAKQEEPKPFGTYMLLNKQAPSAGKSKIMKKILQKKLVEPTKATTSEDSAQEDEEKEDTVSSGAAFNSTREWSDDVSDSKQDVRKEEKPGAVADGVLPKTSEKKPTAGAAKSSLEKALKKKSLAAAGKQSGLRKPATPKGL